MGPRKDNPNGSRIQFRRIKNVYVQPQTQSQAFAARKILKGCQSLGPFKDYRLPITPDILQKILHVLNHTVPF